MTLQLNPNVTDGYESMTLAQLRAKVFDALGFMATPSGGADTLGGIRVAIMSRLGLAAALIAGTDTYTNISAKVYNGMGWAGQSGTHPPGVDELVAVWISNAQRDLFARIEFDKGGVTPPAAFTSGTSTLDAIPIILLATAYGKAHYGKADAQAYFQQVEKYCADLVQRTPANITAIVNAAIVEAHAVVYRRAELGLTDFDAETALFLAIKIAGYSSTRNDNTLTLVDATPVQLLALAMLKERIGQNDAKSIRDEYERYFADLVKRRPPNAVTLVNQVLRDVQQQLYRKYEVFRMERWWTWTTTEGQRFYGTFDDDNAQSIAPTDGLAQQGSAVVSHEMKETRTKAGSILLHDGTVLYAGGYSSLVPGNLLTTSELYDPSTGVFSSAGSLLHGHVLPHVITLDDGTILIAGSDTSTVYCEIYNPTSKTFSATGSLVTGRAGSVSAKLPDGRVLVAGGLVNFTTYTNSAEVYDPVTKTWSMLSATMSAARANANCAQLIDGRIIIVGGVNISGLLTAAEIFDPVTNTFSAGPSLSTGRTLPSVVALANGNVLVAGGGDATLIPIASAEVYNYQSGSFAPTGSMVNPRFEQGSVLLASKKVLLAGTRNFTPGVPDAAQETAEIYDPESGTWSATSNDMPVGERYSGAVLLLNGRVLLAGGSTGAAGNTSTVKTAMLYDPDNNTFSLTGSLTQGTSFYEITAITANGESLPVEFFVTGIPANTAVNLSWTPYPNQPFVVGFRIYRGKTTGNEGFIAEVPVTQTTYIDEGTIPGTTLAPTVNTTAGPGALDPRHVTWVGLSFQDNVWNPLIKGIPPEAFAQNITGVPTNYEIRQALEIWPPPSSDDWKIQIKGYFQPMVFESDTDYTSMDWQAVYYSAVAELKGMFGNRFTPVEIARAQNNAKNYIGALVAKSHMTAKYVPGRGPVATNAVRPKLV